MQSHHAQSSGHHATQSAGLLREERLPLEQHSDDTFRAMRPCKLDCEGTSCAQPSIRVTRRAHVRRRHAGSGFSEALHSILSLREGRDVFIIGAANVGKSAFVRRMVKEMSNMSSRHFDMMASNASRRMPVVSPMPGTTLGRVQLAAFSSGGHLFDTPGAPSRALPTLSPYVGYIPDLAKVDHS